ncbi:MAG TPA: DUF2846 domain-containing protein [Candidatus Acidoferrales bacterium]|jgi:hypothetical protein|nr:DUF2846 domain-containing protein [Candidatus Acidoferrales bacterium]
MRIILLLFLFAVPASAQSVVGVATAPGCGAPSVNFSVKTDKKQHPFAQADAGKALVYFVEDDSNFAASPKPTIRAGLDGNWVGATHGSSYFYFPVDPGEHDLCASWQGKFLGSYRSVVHFHAEPGELYFFRAKDVFSDPKDGPLVRTMNLKSITRDEGQLLASEYALATAKAKK